MKRLYPQVGRNLAVNREALVQGIFQVLGRGLWLMIDTVSSFTLPPRSRRLRVGLAELLKICCGLSAIVFLHSLPNRWRRIVLWEQPNFGEFGLGTYYLFRWLDKRGEPDPQRYVFLTSSSHNRTLVKMVRRRIRVVENRVLYEWFRPPFNTARAAKFSGYSGPFWDLEDSPAHLDFDPAEEAEGQELMKRIGVKASQKMVCVHWRDSAFLNATAPEEGVYSTSRNTSLTAMLPTLQMLADRGFSVLRMGAEVEERLPERLYRSRPNIIDYASQHRTDLGDVYLIANCQLFVGTSSGPGSVAQAFNRQTVLVDYHLPQLMNLWNSNAMVIFRRYRFRDGRRHVCYPEMMARWPWFWNDLKLEQSGIEAVPNTAEEILAAVQEGLERLEGIDESTDEDQELQRRFWAMFPPENVRGKKLPRIGRKFLRDNQHLLS